MLLAVLAAEGVFGEARVSLDCRYAIDESIRAIIVDAATPVGMLVNSIFVTFILREFGREAFDVWRVEGLCGRAYREDGR